MNCFCLKKKDKQKRQSKLQKIDHHKEQQNLHPEVQKSSKTKDNSQIMNMGNIDNIVSAVQVQMQKKQRSQSFSNYQKQVIQYVRSTNPAFQKTRKIQFPSPFIKYKIIPYLHQKQALDAATTNNHIQDYKKNSLIRYDYHGGPNQHFFFKKIQKNLHYIINVSKGFTVQVPDSQTAKGVQIIIDPRNDTNNQFWQLQEASKLDTYIIRSFCGKCLTVTSGLLESVKVTQQQYSGQKNQMWVLSPA